MYTKYSEQDLKAHVTHFRKPGSRLQRVWFREVSLYRLAQTHACMYMVAKPILQCIVGLTIKVLSKIRQIHTDPVSLGPGH